MQTGSTDAGSPSDAAQDASSTNDAASPDNNSALDAGNERPDIAAYDFGAYDISAFDMGIMEYEGEAEPGVVCGTEVCELGPN